MSRATLLGVGAIACWSVLALLSRAAAAVPPFQLAAMAFAVPGAGGLAWLAWRGELAVLRQPPAAWLHGAGGLFLYHALFFAALARAPAAEANLINYAWPLLIVLLASPVLGLRLGAWHLAGVAAGLAGCLLLLAGDARFDRAAASGYACAAAAAVVWALYSLLARRLRGVPSRTVIGFCAGASLLAALAHAAVEPTVIPDAAALRAILLLGLGPAGGAFLLWDIGMKRGDPRLLGTLAYATPVASTLLLGAAGYAVLTPTILAAAALVAAGGWIAAHAR